MNMRYTVDPQPYDVYTLNPLPLPFKVRDPYRDERPVGHAVSR